MKFGDNLRNLRKLKKISQEGLAEKVGVTRQSVSKWECGEAYPEMINILCLCDIFQCKINDLVHEDLVDLDSLDDEVKMNIVKFKKEKQNKMKGLSKTIYILARICKIALIIGIVSLVLVSLIMPVIINNIKIIDNNTIEIFNEKIDYQNKGNHIIATYNNQEFEITNIETSNLINMLENNSNIITIGLIEIALIIFIITCILIYLMLRHLEKLFMNIHNGETPFTLENANHIKNMAKLMIVTIILPIISGIILQLIINQDLGVGFELLDIIYILFLFSMVYIFEYGYEIQLDSKGKMYGEE